MLLVCFSEVRRRNDVNRSNFFAMCEGVCMCVNIGTLLSGLFVKVMRHITTVIQIPISEFNEMPNV